MPIQITDSNCGFQWITSQTHGKVLEAIKDGNDRDHIDSWVERLFDQIADGFWETQRLEVKKFLYDLLSPASADKEKHSAFHQLIDMVSEPHKNKFSSEISNNIKTLIIHLENTELKTHVSLESAVTLEREISASAPFKLCWVPFGVHRDNSIFPYSKITIDDILVINKTPEEILDIAAENGYTGREINCLSKILTVNSHHKLLNSLGAPLVMRLVGPENICVQIKKDNETRRITLSLSLDSKKIEKLADFIDISSEKTFYLKLYKAQKIIEDGSYSREKYQNEEKIHSAEISVSFDLDVIGKPKDEFLSNKITEYTGPESGDWVNNISTPSLEMDIFNSIKIRYSVFLGQLSTQDCLNPSKSIIKIHQFLDKLKEKYKTESSNFSINNEIDKFLNELHKSHVNPVEFNDPDADPSNSYLKKIKIRVVVDKYISKEIRNKIYEKISIEDFLIKEPDDFNKIFTSFLADKEELARTKLSQLSHLTEFDTSECIPSTLSISDFQKIFKEDIYEFRIKDKKLIDRLLIKSANSKCEILIKSIIENCGPGLYKIKENLIDKTSFAKTLDDGSNLFMYIIKLNDKNITQRAIDLGVQITKIEGSEGNSTIFHAIKNENKEILKHIICNEELSKDLTFYDFNGQDNEGNNALHLCCRKLNFYTKEIITAQGFLLQTAENEINILEPDGYQKLYRDLIKKLLEFNADPCLPDSDGFTPLSYIVDIGNMELFDIMTGR